MISPITPIISKTPKIEPNALPINPIQSIIVPDSEIKMTIANIVVTVLNIKISPNIII